MELGQYDTALTCAEKAKKYFEQHKILPRLDGILQIIADINQRKQEKGDSETSE